MEIYPTVLTDDKQEFGDFIEKLNDVILPNGFPLKRIQVDINDGSFLNVKTIEPEVVAQYDFEFAVDYHLMVENPHDWVDRCAKGKADRIIAQVEKVSDQIAFFEKVKEWRLGVGFALDIMTEIHEIHPELLSRLDVVLLMSYPAGHGGQEFDNEVFNKIRELKNKKDLNGCSFSIFLDGGVSLENIKQIKLAGVDEVCVGEKLIVGDIEENFERFYKAMY